MIDLGITDTQKDGAGPNSCCPKCGPVETTVVDSRRAKARGHQTIMRRRKCASCGARFTTIEMTEVSANDFAQEALTDGQSDLQKEAKIAFYKDQIAGLKDKLVDLL